MVASVAGSHRPHDLLLSPTQSIFSSSSRSSSNSQKKHCDNDHHEKQETATTITSVLPPNNNDDDNMMNHLPKENNNKESNHNNHKSVQFVSYACVVHIPHVNDYTSDELDDLYYHRDDFSKFRKTCKRMIQKMKDGQTDDIPYNTDCTRGLKENTHTYHQNRRTLRRKLLEYITAQRKLCLFCGEDWNVVTSRIATYCERMAGPSMNTARAVGVCDELEVRSIYCDDISYYYNNKNNNNKDEFSLLDNGDDDDDDDDIFTEDTTADSQEQQIRARCILLTNNGQTFNDNNNIKKRGGTNNNDHHNDDSTSSSLSPRSFSSPRASYSYRMRNNKTMMNHRQQSLTSLYPVPRIS